MEGEISTHLIFYFQTFNNLITNRRRPLGLAQPMYKYVLNSKKTKNKLNVLSRVAIRQKYKASAKLIRPDEVYLQIDAAQFGYLRSLALFKIPLNAECNKSILNHFALKLKTTSLRNFYSITV